MVAYAVLFFVSALFNPAFQSLEYSHDAPTAREVRTDSSADAKCAKCLKEPDNCSVLLRSIVCGEALDTKAGIEATCKILAGDDVEARRRCYEEYGR